MPDQQQREEGKKSDCHALLAGACVIEQACIELFHVADEILAADFRQGVKQRARVGRFLGDVPLGDAVKIAFAKQRKGRIVLKVKLRLDRRLCARILRQNFARLAGDGEIADERLRVRSGEVLAEDIAGH